MINVILYSRSDCHLCEEAKTDLVSLQQQFPHHLSVVDVDSDQNLQQEYGSEVPVVEIGPYRLKPPFSRQALQMTLGAAQDRERHIQRADDAMVLNPAQKSKTWTKIDGFTYWLGRHYLAVFNIFVLIYVGLPFLAPVLMNAGAQAPAGLIYRAYSMVCHQLAYRSFFLFGEQVVYPRAAAGVEDLLTYSQASGLNEDSNVDSLFAAREFIGNPALGYKVAICERDVAIYGGILAFGLLYAATKRRIPPIPWYLWILLAILPVGFDGLSQLLSQPPFSFWAYRESTPFLRTMTGALFGFVTAWFGYPMVEQTMAETRQIMSDKLARVRRFA